MNAVGVDVGGTKIAAAVVTPKGRILNEVRYPTQAVPPNRLVETIARAITEVKDGFEVGGVCLAVPGLILAAENKVIFAPNLHEIENIRLDQEIGGTVGMSVTVENDANAAAWGEFRFGAGIDVEHQVFVTLGTGVGGGIITHGVLLRGAQGAGGELGHVTIDPAGPRCGCGNHGCLEALASGTAIRRRAREVANDRPQSALGRLAVEREVLGEDVTRLAREGRGFDLGPRRDGAVAGNRPGGVRKHLQSGGDTGRRRRLQGGRSHPGARPQGGAAQGQVPLARSGRDKGGDPGPGIRGARRGGARPGRRRRVRARSLQAPRVKGE
jgi:predicted NBD/HSP70 family sugar kinase